MSAMAVIIKPNSNYLDGVQNEQILKGREFRSPLASDVPTKKLDSARPADTGICRTGSAIP